MTAIPFTKMHASGNDFAIILRDPQHPQTATNDWQPLDQQIQDMARRRRGIGFDQLLLLTVDPSSDADFLYHIYNADGSSAEQCGNGARCVGRFLQRAYPQHNCNWRLRSHDKHITTVQVHDNTEVSADMGVPCFTPAEVPFDAETQATFYKLKVDPEMYEIGVVSMGNPHAIIQVPDCSSTPVARLGEAISCHPRFPQQTNVGFMQVLDRQHLQLRVYERGVGETPACGSGACAAAAIAHLWGLVDNELVVQQAGGSQHIQWQGEGKHMIQRGPASFVYDGNWNPS